VVLKILVENMTQVALYLLVVLVALQGLYQDLHLDPDSLEALGRLEVLNLVDLEVLGLLGVPLRLVVLGRLQPMHLVVLAVQYRLVNLGRLFLVVLVVLVRLSQEDLEHQWVQCHQEGQLIQCHLVALVDLVDQYLLVVLARLEFLGVLLPLATLLNLGVLERLVVLERLGVLERLELLVSLLIRLEDL
jgi:hypothetical protein